MSCVATHRLSLTTHSCREHHRKPFWRTLGYRIPFTKYTTYQRGTGGKVGIEVTFTGDMKLTMSKDVYLPFERRQQTELHRYVESLPAACWKPHRTRGGGCRPVDCANSSAIRATKNTVLVADDTDLVMICTYFYLCHIFPRLIIAVYFVAYNVE